VPALDHGFLDHVLRVGLGAGLLPGKEQQTWSVL
jgi:hypothetical protein